MRFFSILLFSLAASAVFAEDFLIDDYDFYWTVAEVGNTKLTVNKDAKSTVLLIKSGYSSPSSYTGEEASKIANELKGYVTIMNSLAKGQTKEAAAGEHKIIFKNDEKYGFSAMILGKGIVGSSVSLDAKEIKTFLPHLLKAKEMIEYVDKKIKP